MKDETNPKFIQCKLVELMLLRQYCELAPTPIATPYINCCGLEQWNMLTVRAKHGFYDDSQRLIGICLDKCDDVSKMGQRYDRSPAGVIAHEFGHHVDAKYSEAKNLPERLSTWLHRETGEICLTRHAKKSDHEWFAEAFRLFALNCLLSQRLMPKTYRWMSDNLRGHI